MKTRPSKALVYLFIGVLLSSLLPVNSAIAQPIFNAGFGTFQFTAANKIHKIGTNGSAAGNVTLYTNVITIAGQPIDCIIRTVSITNGSFALPSGASAGTIPFDYATNVASGGSMTANLDRFFAPTVTFNSGGGNVKFKFEFILGGSYNNTTHTGTKVVLQNVRLNTYDIDGNGGASSNQYNEFGGFASVALGATTNISQSYNTATGLTKFRSNSSTNVATVTDPVNRVRVEYSMVSDFEIMVGADASGPAYFFLDFSNYVFSNVIVYSTPGFDLNSETAGFGNANGSCTGTKRFTNGPGYDNITSSSGVIDEIIITYDPAMIQNGNSEVLFPKGNASLPADSIRLGFTAAVANKTFTIGGVQFAVVRTADPSVNTIRLRKLTGIMTTAQAEMLLDSLYYENTSLTPTVGSRIFGVSIREGSFTSPIANFDVSEICILPVRWLGFNAGKDAKGQLKLDWQVADDANAIAYEVEYSRNGMQWLKLGQVDVYESSSHTGRYTFHSLQSFNGLVYFRIRQLDLSGQYGFSAVRVVEFSKSETFRFWPNPAIMQIQVEASQAGELQILNQYGQLHIQTKVLPGYAQFISIGHLPKGVYILRFQDLSGNATVSRLLKN
jgi:hypothetical protein